MSEQFAFHWQHATPSNRCISTVLKPAATVAFDMHGALDCRRSAVPVLPGPASQHIHPTAIPDGHHFRSVATDRSTPTHPTVSANPDATWNLRLLAASLLALGQSLILSDGHGCYCFLLAISTTKSIDLAGQQQCLITRLGYPNPVY